MGLKATIMIPAYNAEKFLKETLKSAINQTYNDYEILVVNDGSTDDTQGILAWYQKRYNNIRLIDQNNQGTSSARNRLLDEARGEILFGLDADDILSPRALEELINCFDNNPSVNHIYTDQLEIEEDGKGFHTRERFSCHTFSDSLTYHCHFQGHLKSFRRSLIEDTRFDENLKSAVDWNFFLKLYPNARILHFPKILYAYRRNKKGISFTKRKEVIQNSIDLVRKYVGERKLYGDRNFEVVPVNAGENIHYYDHIVDGKSSMNPQAREVLERYLKKGY